MSDVVFVGHVIAIEPETEEGLGTAKFQVETWVKGGSGDQFVAGQGSGGSCVWEFEANSHVIFAGSNLVMDNGVAVTLANDTGHDPTVVLSDPLTAEQIARLEYLKQIAAAP